MNKNMKNLVLELRDGFNSMDKRKKVYKEILENKENAIPFLENIIKEVLKYSFDVDIDNEEILMECFLLLGELESEKSLDLILESLKRNSEFVDYFFEEFLSEHLWIVISKLGKNNLDKLFDFARDKKIDMYSRLAITLALIDIESKNKVIRKKLLDLFKELLYEKNKDIDFNIMIIVNIMDMGGKELKNEVMEVFNKYEEKQSIIGKDEIDFERTYFAEYSDKNIYELIDEVFEINEIVEIEKSSKPKEKPRRVVKRGRNDPCPCGSGKKYKKCCAK